jgi:hypothetical protein
MDGGHPEAAAPTAIRARRGRGRAGHVIATALVAALAGLCAGLVVGWALPHPVVPVTAPPAPRFVAPQPRLAPPAPPPPPVLAAPRPRPPASRRPRRPVFRVDAPWWSDLVNENPYR